MKIARSTMIALALTTAFAAGTARTAQAQVVTYNTRSIFLSALTAPTTVTFSNEHPGDYDVQYVNGGSTTIASGVTVSSPSQNLLIVGNPSGVYGADRGTGGLEILMPTGNNTAQMTVSFSSWEKAFGFDFGSYTGQVDAFTYVLSNGQTGTFRNNNTTALTFFGLTSATPFNSVTLRVADAATAYDNFTYASSLATTTPPVTATPEPGTWVMMATGLLGIGAVARRRKKRLPA